MAREQFPGLLLTDEDQAWLAGKKRERLPQFTWKRLRILELLGEGWTLTAVAAALQTHRREVRRVAWRAVDLGLEASLVDEPRTKQPKLLSTKQEATLTAMVCGPPPEGFARWSVRLVAAEAVDREIVDSIGRETIRLFLSRHDLKPWREKNVVRAADRHRVHRSNGGRARSPRATV